MHDYVLGIDFGSHRVGVAVGQTLSRQARALRTLSNNKNLFDALSALIDEWQIKQLVVGLPLAMDGSEQEITRRVKNFSTKLTKHSGLPVHLVDERLTSFEAERQFQQRREMQLSKAKNKDQIDALAAQVILQSWFDQLETPCNT